MLIDKAWLRFPTLTTRVHVCTGIVPLSSLNVLGEAEMRAPHLLLFEPLSFSIRMGPGIS